MPLLLPLLILLTLGSSQSFTYNSHRVYGIQRLQPIPAPISFSIFQQNSDKRIPLLARHGNLQSLDRQMKWRTQRWTQDDEYLKKVQELRNKVANLQKARQNSLKKLSESRNLAKKNLLTKINPIVQKYMTDNNIRMILDKKGVLMGDKTLEITDKIITIINKEITSIKIN